MSRTQNADHQQHFKAAIIPEDLLGMVFLLKSVSPWGYLISVAACVESAVPACRCETAFPLLVTSQKEKRVINIEVDSQIPVSQDRWEYDSAQVCLKAHKDGTGNSTSLNKNSHWLWQQ